MRNTKSRGWSESRANKTVNVRRNLNLDEYHGIEGIETADVENGKFAESTTPKITILEKDKDGKENEKPPNINNNKKTRMLPTLDFRFEKIEEKDSGTVVRFFRSHIFSWMFFLVLFYFSHIDMFIFDLI